LDVLRSSRLRPATPTSSAQAAICPTNMPRSDPRPWEPPRKRTFPVNCCNVLHIHASSVLALARNRV